MKDKIGVFICTGYGIAEALDIEAMRKVVASECKVPFCKTIDSCEKPALQAVIEDIAREGLGKVVIAGISPRRYPDVAFPDGVVVEKIALLEHVVWTQPPGDEGVLVGGHPGVADAHAALVALQGRPAMRTRR